MTSLFKYALALSLGFVCTAGTCSDAPAAVEQRQLQELQARFATQATAPDLQHALMEQAYYGRPKSFTWLVQRGADCNLRGENGANVLMLAADGIARPMQSQLDGISGAEEVPWKDEEHFRRAADQTFDLALACSGDVNATDHDGRSAIQFAAKNKRWDAVAKLVAKGANINRPDRNGATILLKASAADWPLLVKHGANINAADIRGSTVLHQAFHHSTSKALFEHVNAATALGARDSRDKQGKFASEMDALAFPFFFEPGDYSLKLVRLDEARALIRKTRQ